MVDAKEMWNKRYRPSGLWVIIGQKKEKKSANWMKERNSESSREIVRNSEYLLEVMGR